MYIKPNKEVWNGRVDSDDQTDTFRLHQMIECKDVQQVTTKYENAFSLIGFESDEGVRRNQGRTGAALGPAVLRKMLANLPYHLERPIMDTGNVQCVEQELESAQHELGDYLEKLYRAGCTPIILGGGHETLYGHYTGIRNYIGKNSSLGIINIDAHFDMRADKLPSSGTMFRQILESDDQASYMCLGIQENGNTKDLFKRAEKFNVHYRMEEDIRIDNLTETYEVIDTFSSEHDYIILTLCTDSISAQAAPGVSAPAPFGFDPKVVKKMIQHIVKNSNVKSMDISEVNPKYDIDNRTARLGAYLLNEAMKNFN